LGTQNGEAAPRSSSRKEPRAFLRVHADGSSEYASDLQGDCQLNASVRLVGICRRKDIQADTFQHCMPERYQLIICADRKYGLVSCHMCQCKSTNSSLLHARTFSMQLAFENRMDQLHKRLGVWLDVIISPRDKLITCVATEGNDRCSTVTPEVIY